MRRGTSRGTYTAVTLVDEAVNDGVDASLEEDGTAEDDEVRPRRPLEERVVDGGCWGSNGREGRG